MATDTSTMMENLLTAINIIAEKKVESLPYDKTLTCTIVNADNAAKGEYSVTDGTSTFLAYSDNTTYKVNTRIYVTVPNGDFNNKKIIKGKYIAGEEEPYYTYVSPLDNFLDITGNIYGYNDTNAITDKIGLIANSTNLNKILIWSLGYTETTSIVGKYDDKTDKNNKLTELNLNQYTRLGIGGSFSTRLSGVITGHYGLSLEVITEIPQRDAVTTEVPIQQVLDGELILTEPLQQIVINKVKQEINSGIEGYAAALDELRGLPDSVLSSFTIDTRWQTKYKKYKYELDSQNMFGNPYRFIIPSNQEILFDISDIKNEQIVGLQMYFYEVPNFRTIDGSLFPVAPYSNLFVQDIVVSFGYDTKEYTEDTILCYTTASTTYLSTSRTTEDIKTLELNKKKVQARWIHKQDNGRMYAIDQEDEIPTYQIDDTHSLKMATVHWYQYRLDKPNVGDEIAGPQWEEIGAWQNTFAVDFTPDDKKTSERLKVVVEYPSVEYVNNMITSSGDLSDINDIIIEAQREKQSLELSLVQLQMTDPNNSTEMQRLKNEIEQAEYDIDIAIRQYDKVYNDIQASIGTKYYESEILVFYNESEVENQVNTDLVQGLVLECDVEDRNGKYYCYNDQGKIMDYGMASKLRYLRAQYNSILTFSSKDVSEIITWYFPLHNTMIAPPKAGVTFDRKDANGNSLETTDSLTYGEINDSASVYNGYYYIRRVGSNILGAAAHDEGETYIPTTIEQLFQIKDYYVSTYKNNTIYCEVVKNNIKYIKSVTLEFDYGSSQGTKYTFVLTPSDEAMTVDFVKSEDSDDYIVKRDSVYNSTITLTPHIYDYNHNDITEKYKGKITYSWYSYTHTFSGVGGWFSSDKSNILTNLFWDNENQQWKTTTNDDSITLRPRGGAKQEDLYFYILEAKVYAKVDDEVDKSASEPVVKSKSISFTALYPVAIRSYIYNEDKKPYYGNFHGNSLISYNSQGTNPLYYKETFSCQSINTVTNKFETIDGLEWRMTIKENDNIIDDKNTNFPYSFYPRFVHKDGLEKNALIVPSMYLVNGTTKKIAAIGWQGQYLVWIQPMIINQYGYESEMLNSWDGHLTIDDKNDTILSAMVGAGVKNSDNTFSGVLMGQVSKATPSEPGVGLYGYNNGVQSFGLRVNGTAFLGKSGCGQINFDGNKGTITTPHFSEINESNEDIGSGMHIDLDDGILQIKNKGKLKIKMQPSFDKNDEGYFMVNGQNEVRLINIGNNTYYLQTSNYNTTNHTGTKIDLGNGRIQSYNFTILAYGTGNNSGNWIQIQSSHGTTPLAIGGETSANAAKFHVNWDGTLHATGAIISGDITSDSGTIGGWNISETALWHGDDANTPTHYLGAAKTLSVIGSNKTNIVFKAGTGFGVDSNGALYSNSGNIGGWILSATSLSHASNSHYLGSGLSGVAINGYTSTSSDPWVFKAGSNFGVTSSGKLYANEAVISGNITAKGGYIGNGASGWTIGNTSIYNEMTSLGDTSHNGVYIGTDGIALGKGVFKVTNTGALTATDVTITGTITATGGKIGGIEIINGSISTGIWNAISANVGTLIANTVTAEYIEGKHAVLGSLSVSDGAVYSASAFTSGTGFNAGSTGYVEAGTYKVGDTTGASGSLTTNGGTFLEVKKGLVTSITDGLNLSNIFLTSIPAGVAAAGQYNVYEPGTTNRIGVVIISQYS